MNQSTDLKPETSVEPADLVDVDAVEVTALPTEDRTAADADNITTEEFRIQGDELVAKVKTLIHEGSIRRIIVNNTPDRTKGL